MKAFVRIAAASLLAIPMAVQAQAECDVDQTNPQFVARSWLALSKASATLANNGDPSNDLRDLLRTLTDPRARDRDKNVIGQQYLTAQAYLLLLGHGTPEVVRAGDIGIQANPDETIDLVVATDTLLRAVEAAHPECAETIAEFRQYKPWVEMINAAINTLNANQPDSAEKLANRSLILYAGAPYAHSVLGAVAQSRGQDSVAIGYFRKALEVAGSDTLYAEMRANTLGDIARLLGEQATTAPAAQQRALAREAITAYNAYLAEPEINDAVRAISLGQLANLYQVAGDTANLRQIYASIVQNPANYGENTLLQAGAIAMAASAYTDASKLFSTVFEANPHHRDGVNNLAASYVGTKEYAKVFPLVDRLRTLEPNNPDAALLYAYAYTGLVQDAREAAARKTYTDSLVKYSTLAEQMPTAVTVTEFSRARTETRVSGTISNRSRAAKTYSLTVELLGKDGSVVGTQEVSIGPVAAGGRENFRVTVPVAGENVAGYRYRPLT